MTEEDIKNNKTLYNWNKYLEAKKLLCETNMQFIQIENETGISRSFLESIYHRRLLIKEYKNICFPIRSRKLKDIISEEDKEKLMDMLKQGKTISEIQEVFHIGHDGVKIILDSLGINRKDIEGAIQQKHPVYQYDLLGNFIKRYSSIKEAWQEMGLKNGASIGNCCTGRINSIKGFKWFFTPQENIIITKYDKICYITGRTHNNMYSIIQYNQNYKPIKFFISAKSLNRSGFGSLSTIKQICLNKEDRLFRNSYWKFAQDASEEDIDYFVNLKKINPNSEQLFLE